MTRDDLARTQAEGAVRDLFALAMHARRWFLRSADLVGMRGPAIEALRKWGWEPVDLAPLLPAWAVLCDRYLEERYDPQLTLFANPPLSEAVTAWGQFVHWHLFPHILRENEVVRNLLRTLGGLPARSPQDAATSIRIYLAELPLPQSKPPWAPEESSE